MPEDGLDQLLERDAILLGAVGDPACARRPVALGAADPDPPHVRPVREPAARAAPARGRVAHSRTGGARHGRRPGERRGRVLRNRRPGLPRPAGRDGRPGGGIHPARGRAHRRVRDRARQRAAARLVSATKSNGIIHTMPFWDEVVAERCRELRGDGGEGPDRRARGAAGAAARQRSTSSSPPTSSATSSPTWRPRVAGSIGMAPQRQPQPRRELPLDVRARPRFGARHRRPGHRQPVGQMWVAAMMLEHLGRGCRRGSHGRDRSIPGRPGHAERATSAGTPTRTRRPARC